MTELDVDNYFYLCLKEFGDVPNDINLAKLLDCMLAELSYFVKDCKYNDAFDIIRCIDLFDLKFPKFADKIVYTIIKICHSNRKTLIDSTILDALFDLISGFWKKLSIKVQLDVFKAFHWYSHVWKSYLDFCDIWNLDNFGDDEFKIENRRNSIGESAYIACSRCWNRIAICKYTFDFYINYISKICKYNLTVYSNYHIAFFLIRIGYCRDDILRVYRPYIECKHRKPWSWLTLSHVFEYNSIEYQACRLFAADFCDDVDTDALDAVDYKKICHDIFARVQSVDLELWYGILHRLVYIRDNDFEYKKIKTKNIL